MTGTKPRTPSIAALVTRLTKATTAAQTANQKAEDALAKRDAIAVQAADAGVTYARLAEAMGITVDGVTYVLRKVRRART